MRNKDLETLINDYIIDGRSYDDLELDEQLTLCATYAEKLDAMSRADFFDNLTAGQILSYAKANDFLKLAEHVNTAIIQMYEPKVVEEFQYAEAERQAENADHLQEMILDNRQRARDMNDAA